MARRKHEPTAEELAEIEENRRRLIEFHRTYDFDDAVRQARLRAAGKLPKLTY